MSVFWLRVDLTLLLRSLLCWISPRNLLSLLLLISLTLFITVPRARDVHFFNGLLTLCLSVMRLSHRCLCCLGMFLRYYLVSSIRPSFPIRLLLVTAFFMSSILSLNLPWLVLLFSWLIILLWLNLLRMLILFLISIRRRIVLFCSLLSLLMLCWLYSNFINSNSFLSILKVSLSHRFVILS